MTSESWLRTTSHESDVMGFSGSCRPRLRMREACHEEWDLTQAERESLSTGHTVNSKRSRWMTSGLPWIRRSRLVLHFLWRLVLAHPHELRMTQSIVGRPLRELSCEIARATAAEVGTFALARIQAELGGDVMSGKNRSFLLFSLVLAVLLGGVFSIVQADDVKPTKWSDPATWPDHKVPAAGDKVTIEKGKEVVLDVSPPGLHGLTVNGTLSFSDKADLELATEWIVVRGELAIGSEAKPHTRKATITLTNEVPNEEIDGAGDRGIIVESGTLSLHGDRKNSWTKLASTAEAGSTSIEVLSASQWRPGDTIVLASTDFDPRQAERRTISAIHGNTITLDQKLEYMHFGKIT